MTELDAPGAVGRLRPRPPLDAVVRADRSLPYGLGDQLLALYARCDGFRSRDARVNAADLGDLDPADVGTVADDLAAWIAGVASSREHS